MMSKLTAAYRSTLLVVLRWRWLVVILLIALMGFGYAVYRDSHTELAPRQDMGAMLVSITPPANSSYRYMDYYAKKVGNMISAMPQVSHTVMNIGQTWAFAFVQLKPWSTRHVKAQTLIAKLNREAQNIPGVQVAAFNLNQLGGGGKYGNSVRVAIMTNDSYLQLHQEAKRLIRELNRYPGIHNAVQDLNLNSRHYVIHIDRNLLAAMHVSMASVTNTLQTMLGGANVTNFKWDNREYGVLLQVPEKALRNHQILNQLYVRNFSDNMIPLSSLVSLQTEVGPSMLPHRNRMRADTLTMQIKPGYTMGEVVHYLQRHLKSLLPSGYQYRFKGGARRMLKSHHVLVGVFSLALIFIYLVLAAQFESFIDPFIILLTVPLSIVGALVTLKLTGHALSIYAAIGLVTLVGLIAKHGILITEFSNQLRREGQSKTDALVEAASLRLRPILMTTAAMVLGAVPLAFAAGAGALSRAQIGWVIIGGMTFGTLFSLFIVPVAYSLLSRKKT